jgi:hypothetical protein
VTALQEELENKSVVLATKATKLTAQTLAKLMRAALRKMKKSKGALKPGRQSMKELSKGGALSSVEITDGNIKAFDPVARKYNVSYSLKKDAASEPPRWLVFFRAKDVDSMTAAFREFSAKMVKREKDKPSIRESMRKNRETIKNAVRDKTKHKHREGPEL